MCNLYYADLWIIPTISPERARAAAIVALARLAEAGELVSGASGQLRRVRPRAKSGDEEKRPRLVRDRGKPAAVLLRWHLDRVQGRPRHQVEADPGPSPRLRIPHNIAERRRRADPLEGHAGHPDHRGGARRLDARSVG